MTAEAHSSSGNEVSPKLKGGFSLWFIVLGHVHAILLRTWIIAIPSELVSLTPAILAANTATRLLFLEHLQDHR